MWVVSTPPPFTYSLVSSNPVAGPLASYCCDKSPRQPTMKELLFGSDSGVSGSSFALDTTREQPWGVNTSCSWVTRTQGGPGPSWPLLLRILQLPQPVFSQGSQGTVSELFWSSVHALLYVWNAEHRCPAQYQSFKFTLCWPGGTHLKSQHMWG